MCVAVNSHALPVYKKNRIALLLCIFETTIVYADKIVGPDLGQNYQQRTLAGDKG